MVARRLPLPLGVKQAKGQSGLFSSESLINLYPEAARGSALAPVHMLGVPGQTLFSTIGGEPRGQFTAGDTHFAIRDQSLYTVTPAGVATFRGTIDGTARCDFAFDGTYVHIVADIASYTYEVASGLLLQQTDVDFERAVSVAVVNNLAVYARWNSGQIAWPSLTNGRAFDGLDFAEAETSPDSITAVRENAQELLIYSHDSLEFWRFTGNPDQYFEASSAGSAIKVGTNWRDSIATMDNAPFWLANNEEGALYVARLEGYQARRVSTHPIETLLERAGSLDDALGFTYAQRGHSFYCLTIPDWCTVAYDVATGEWHQRLAGSWPLSTPEVPQGDYAVRDFTVNESRVPILGKRDGNLYSLDFGSYSADGSGICREITAPPFYADGLSFSISEIEMVCATGVGLTSGTGSEPKVQMALSHDGGKTWSEPFEEELGPIGEYGWGVRFNRCGRCPGPKGVMVRFRCVDPVEFTPISAFITIDVGSR